jgi:hypothetical protein
LTVIEDNVEYGSADSETFSIDGGKSMESRTAPAKASSSIRVNPDGNSKKTDPSLTQHANERIPRLCTVLGTAMLLSVDDMKLSSWISARQVPLSKWTIDKLSHPRKQFQAP